MREIQQRTCGKILIMIMHGAEEYASMFDQLHTLGGDPLCDEPHAAVPAAIAVGG